jgi:hypothetical protein
MNRANSFEDRPPSARPSTGNVSLRGNSYAAGNAFGNVNRGRSNFGNSRLGSASLTNASFSNSGSGRLGGARSADFGRRGLQNGFGHDSEGYNGFRRGHFGYGAYGNGGYGYGHFGYRGWRGGNDLWILGDLFGLALDFGRFAWSPWAPLGLVGLDLLDTGVQALSNLDNNDNGYPDYGYQQPYTYDQPSSAALCGSDYSVENPGCNQ